MKYVLGLDIGTTGCKANVFDEKGRVCAKAYREYLDRQHDGLIDGEGVWQETASAIRECTRAYPVIEAVCAASFGETVVAVDKKGSSLEEAVLYTNDNAGEQWRKLDAKISGDRIAEITGHISHPMYTISRLMWMKEQRPEIYARTDKFLFFSGFIARKLGADCCAENTLAARSMAFDVRKNQWSEEICAAAGIDMEKLPPVVRAGDRIGQVSGKLAEELGFWNRPAILAGGHDQPCVALGMGAVRGGEAVYGMGTVECLTLVMDGFRQTPQMREKQLVCAPHVVEGKYVTYGVLFSGGVVISDLRNKLFSLEKEAAPRQGRDVYEIMMEEMPDGETDLCFLPHLAGTGTPQMDTEDKGIIYGLTLDTTRGELVKAALEGIACDMRLNIRSMEACGLEVKHITGAGGGARSLKGVQVRCDMMGRPVLVARDEQAGARGVFYIMARALGWIRDYGQIAGPPEGTWIYPQKDAEQAEKKFRMYQSLYQKTRDIRKEQRRSGI